MSLESRSREEIAGLVCSALERHGIRAVLSGSSVVVLYAEDAPASLDLDFVVVGVARRVARAMQELEFRKDGRHWRHAETPYWVEFPEGPVSVGETRVTEIAERETALGLLRLLPPTECVMDRLASYYHANDTECLEQAVAVARAHAVDLQRIQAWSERERFPAEYQEFLARLGR